MTIKPLNRDTLGRIVRDDLRAIRWFEEVTIAANRQSGGEIVTGSGGILDMGDRMTGDSFYDGGARV